MNRKKSIAAVLLAGLAGALVVGGLALPRMLGSQSSELLEAAANTEARLAAEAAAAAARAEQEAAAARAAAEAEAQAAAVAAESDDWVDETVDEAVEPNADGDLTVAVDLRWEEYPVTSPVRARIHLRNLSLESFHVPAAGEPQPTLVVIVATEAGEEVRRIVEGAPDRLTRRTALLEPGERVVLPLDIVAPGEEALPPGRYTAFAEYRADPGWTRIGLPMWKSPEGAIYSPRATFVVTPEE